MSPHPQLLTRQEAADVLGVSVGTVKRRIATGDLPAFRDGRRIVRVRRTDLERYIAERIARRSVGRRSDAIAIVLAPGERLWD